MRKGFSKYYLAFMARQNHKLHDFSPSFAYSSKHPTTKHLNALMRFKKKNKREKRYNNFCLFLYALGKFLFMLLKQEY